MPKPTRIYHTWDKWECYPSGFYEPNVKERKDDDVRAEYAAFLASPVRLGCAMARVALDWPRSCEHYLTNERMNRLGWICQAAACLELGLPAIYWPVFFTLPPDMQGSIYNAALNQINLWMRSNGYDPITLEEAGINTKVNLY